MCPRVSPIGAADGAANCLTHGVQAHVAVSLLGRVSVIGSPWRPRSTGCPGGPWRGNRPAGCMRGRDGVAEADASGRVPPDTSGWRLPHGAGGGLSGRGVERSPSVHPAAPGVRSPSCERCEQRPGKTDLAAFVAVLATANSSDPLVFARIAAACTELALKRRATLMVRILHRAASRRLHSSTPGPRRFSGHLYAHGTAYRSVDFAALAYAACLLPRPTTLCVRCSHAPPRQLPSQRRSQHTGPRRASRLRRTAGDSRDPGCRGRALTERTQPTQRGPETPASVTVSGACGV